MTFEEVLDQAVAMLQRRGRLTYRTLQLHFQLDDTHLEALKDELIYGQRLAVDEDGRVLVWTGGADVPQPAPPPAPQAASTPRVLATPPPADAERRQLTVLFCDLVGSTPLSKQLDPEDLREVVRAYQQTCAAVIQRFDGHIAQLLGDALLVYFGWPQAHEDDAQRAVRTGVGLLEAMRTLNTRLEQEKGIRLGIRVGMHTGVAVIGEMGGGGHREQLALGETPNIASRLQVWPTRIRWCSVPIPTAWCRDISQSRIWDHRSSKGWRRPCASIASWQRAAPRAVWTLLPLPASRRWWAVTRRSPYSWNAGPK